MEGAMYTKKDDEEIKQQGVDGGHRAEYSYIALSIPPQTWSAWSQPARPSAARHPNTSSHIKSCFPKDGEDRHPKHADTSLEQEPVVFRKYIP